MSWQYFGIMANQYSIKLNPVINITTNNEWLWNAIIICWHSMKNNTFITNHYCHNDKAILKMKNYLFSCNWLWRVEMNWIWNDDSYQTNCIFSTTQFFPTFHLFFLLPLKTKFNVIRKSPINLMAVSMKNQQNNNSKKAWK